LLNINFIESDARLRRIVSINISVLSINNCDRIIECLINYLLHRMGGKSRSFLSPSFPFASYKRVVALACDRFLSGESF